MQRLGIPSQFLYYPDENHWVLKPQNSRLWYREVHAWLQRYLEATGAEVHAHADARALVEPWDTRGLWIGNVPVLLSSAP